ncbi:hypothetical protein ACOMHN_009240 [Nucella lapillus]
MRYVIVGGSLKGSLAGLEADGVRCRPSAAPADLSTLMLRPCLTAVPGGEQRPCSLASITTAAGWSTHCPGTLAFITAAAGWSTQRCPWTLALIIDIAAVS